MDDVLTSEGPKYPWRVVDLNELSRQLTAALTIDISADSTSRGVRVVASRLIPPNALRTYREILARDRNEAARGIASTLIRDIRNDPVLNSSRCGTPNVFRREGVDRPARYLGGQPTAVHPVFVPDSTAKSARFFVDGRGRVIVKTFRLEDETDTVFAQLARASFPEWRFAPAMSGHCAVRAELDLSVDR
jgi:hypothetical protein